jgi:hypothetical protein
MRCTTTFERNIARRSVTKIHFHPEIRTETGHVELQNRVGNPGTVERRIEPSARLDSRTRQQMRGNFSFRTRLSAPRRPGSRTSMSTARISSTHEPGGLSLQAKSRARLKDHHTHLSPSLGMVVIHALKERDLV